MQINCAGLFIKLAETPQELEASQRLRYQVFVKELGGRTDSINNKLQLERDQYDHFFDHLILIDDNLPKPNNVVGVYRLLRTEAAEMGAGFYSSNEFDLTKIMQCGRRVLELGRSCIDARYRSGVGLHYLWKGLAEYITTHQIDLLFGAASFSGTNLENVAHGLSFLHHNHLVKEELQITSFGENAVPTDILEPEKINRKLAMTQVPSLIKSYLRLGGGIGKGAYIDHDFNTIDVCMIMDTAQMSQKYKSFYQRSVAA